MIKAKNNAVDMAKHCLNFPNVDIKKKKLSHTMAALKSKAGSKVGIEPKTIVFTMTVWLCHNGLDTRNNLYILKSVTQYV